MYKELETKAGTRSYIGSPRQERRARDLNQMKPIKDENDKVIVEEAHIRER